MQTIQSFLYKNGVWLLLMTALASCTLAGLDMQEDWDFKPHTADPHTNKTCWDFMQYRNQPGQDSVFDLMLKGIAYAGIDPSEYTKTSRTFILLHRDAILRVDASGVAFNDCYFGRYLVPDRDAQGNPIPGVMRPAKSWEEYPKATVKNFLLYLIVEGEHNFGSISTENDTVKTLLPLGCRYGQSAKHYGAESGE